MNSPIVKRTTDKWFLSTNDLHVGSAVYIDWRTLLPKCSGEKHQRSYMIKSVKELIEAMTKLPRTNTSSWTVLGMPGHGTILNWFYSIRRLVRWMIERDIWLFSRLESHDLAEYIDFCSRKVNGSGPIAVATWHQRFGVLQAMWNVRSEYVGSLRIDPAKLTVSTSQKFRQPSSWKALDEDVVMPLLGDALNWIEKYGPLVESALQGYWEFRSKEVGMTRSNIRKRLTAWYSELEKDSLWLEMRNVLHMNEAKTYHVLRHAYGMSRGACADIVLFTVGLRSSELCRLDWDCLRVEVDSNGKRVARLYGVAAKQGGRKRYWVVCDEVIKAIEHIKNITSAARKTTKNKGLWIGGATNSFLRPGARVLRMDHTGLCTAMRKFASAPLRPRKITRLHPHMARKSFARFVILRDKRALGPLAQHYGHIRRAVTDGSYVGSDFTLERMLEEEGRKDLARGLMDLISTDALGGKAATTLAKVREEAMKLRGKKALQRFVDKLIADGVQLAPCDWGYCVYSKFFSACEGDDSGPNEARRSPDICSSCVNFGVTKIHQPWWEERVLRDDEFLARPELPAQTVAFVGARRENSAAILLKLMRSNESIGLEKNEAHNTSPDGRREGEN